MANSYNNGYSLSNNYGLNLQDFSQNNNYRSIPSYNQGEPILLKGRPVSSIEEARALSIDLDGSINYFPDRANKRIYAKYFNPDGSASFEVYVKDNSIENKTKFVTLLELSDAIAEMRMILMNLIAGITATGKSNMNNIPLPQNNESPIANLNNGNNLQQLFNI